jgi:hypothetical protein
MQKTRLSVLLVISALAMLSCTVASQPSSSVPEADLIILEKYRQWTLVNPTPQLMAPAAATDCVIIPGRQEPSPHLNKYISVFVNSVGREAMMTKRTPKFPIGSMIVKEKLGSPDSTNPELLTAMIKREAGYNPEGGDWEYLVLDGAASKIIEQGKLTRCSSCHRPYVRNDFVTRTYLPATVSRELKP